MATIITADSCENAVTVASEPNMDKKKTLEPPSSPELRSQESISVRRDRSLTAFLFEEIAGKKLKCYEKWKLWLGLFICMTIIAVVAIAFASYYAVQINAYESKTDAVDAQSNLLYDIVHDETANISDHTDEAHKIFNTFDDNADGVWDRSEFVGHFVLGSSAPFVFNDIDEDGDNIASWQEIVSYISKYSLSQSYIPSVRKMYNYNFTNATDPLLTHYAANVYLDYYNIPQFGYITREYYYEFRSNISFKYADSDADDLISFDEFTSKIGDDQMIGFLRAWNIESYLESLNRTGVQNGYSIPNPTSTGAINMCPYNRDSTSRRLIDADEIDFDNFGELVYNYNEGDCEATLTCYNDNYGETSLYNDNYGETSLEDNCHQEEIEQIVGCMVSVIDRYLEGEKLVKCRTEMYTCLQDIANVLWSDCEDIHCQCECSDGCHGIDDEPTDESARRLGHYCGRNRCACGSGCICFSGDNQMWIKRDEEAQNILLKDLRIGDYVQTKGGDWSKVWFIKQQESSEYEFLKLYFGEDEYITMTNHHLLYVEDMTEESMKQAEQVKVGDIVFVMKNGTFFEEKEIVLIESTISAHGAYAPVTMEGSIVVSNVLSSCYVESPEKAQRLHDTAAVFRWISSYNTDVASFMTHLFYDGLFMKLRTDYGLDAAHIVFNAYSMPCIVVATVNIGIFGLFRSVSSLFEQ